MFFRRKPKSVAAPRKPIEIPRAAFADEEWTPNAIVVTEIDFAQWQFWQALHSRRKDTMPG